MVGLVWGVLGEIEARRGEDLVPLGHARQRCVLAVLIAEAGQPVTAERLVERVWGDRPPPGALSTLYGYLSRLRRLLGDAGDEAIIRQAGGYVLPVRPGAVDLDQFREMAAEARRVDDDATAAVRFEKALGLWRSEAFGSLSTPWLDRARAELARERRSVELDHADVLLRLGRHDEVLPDAVTRAAELPLDERLTGQLMLALHGSGRTAEALARYDSLRSRLAEDLGIDAGEAVQAIYRRILGQGRTGEPPRQLPREPRSFTGRVAQLRRLGEPARDGAGGDGRIWVIDGYAGVGKTWLALRWAHQQADAFPDGQLYVDLRGFDPRGPARSPEDAVAGFLEALEVPIERRPADPVAQFNLYRSLLANRRVLVLLDNARDAEQVRPLLAAGPACLTLITSRNPLTSLVVTDGADRLPVEPMSRDESEELLASRMGAGRVQAEHESVRRIVAMCGGLPLALSIAAARAANYGALTLAEVAEELDDAASPLEAFDAGDASADLRSVFSWSYRSVPAPAARLFRLLGLHPGNEISTAAAAGLADLPEATAADGLLRELVRAALLKEHRPGRYTIHDLLRAYAGETSAISDSPAERAAAVSRVLDHYLTTARVNAASAGNYWALGNDDIPDSNENPGPVARRRGFAWFAAELNVLRAVILQTAADHPGHAWKLGWALMPYLTQRGYWHDSDLIFQAAAAAAARAGDRSGQGHALFGLALGYARSGRFDDTPAVIEQAWDLADPDTDHILRARISAVRSWLADRNDDRNGSLRHMLQALDLYRAGGFRSGEQEALADLGWCYHRVGRHDRAIACCEQALAMPSTYFRSDLEPAISDTLGSIYAQTGRHHEALGWYQRALDRYEETGDRLNGAIVRGHLAESHQATGDQPAAHAAYRRALRLYEEIDHPDAETIRAKLADCQPGTPGR